MVGIKEYAEVLGRVAALEQVIAFILGRVDVRTAEDVLGMMAASKEQSLNAAAQVGDAKSVNSGPTESLRTTLSAGGL